MEVAYPSNVAINFRKLTTRALLQYCTHHNITGIPPDFDQPQLANIVAEHFSSWKLNEEKALKSFCSNLGLSWNGKNLDQPMVENKREPVQNQPKKRRQRPGTANPAQSNKKHHARVPEPARRGEQVAAQMSSTDENGSWILARVVEYNTSKQVYTVQDEDDVTKVMDLENTRVLRLNDGTTHFSKGDAVLAMFPETTSFYRGVVHKNPSTKGDDQSKSVVIKFEDDEDEQGRTPSRHIPIRFVLRVPSPTDTATAEEKPPLSAPPPRQKSVHSKHAGAGASQPSQHAAASRGQGDVHTQQGTHHHKPPHYSAMAPGSAYPNPGAHHSHPPQYHTAHGVPAAHPAYAPPPGAAGAAGGRGPSPGPPLPPGVLPGGGGVAAGGGTAPPGGGAREGAGKAGGDITYSDMIGHALNQLPDRRGTFKEICGLIEKQFTMQLNWKLGSSALRNTPVWKSSVRKILFSNKNFSHADRCHRRGNVFTFTHLTTTTKK